MSDILPSLKYTRKLINEFSAALFFYYIFEMDLAKIVNKSKSNILLRAVFTMASLIEMHAFPPE